tara:strand:+ start:169 stop:525 length:357 start_codon:yes stop_codon:yes gene_type:complete
MPIHFINRLKEAQQKTGFDIASVIFAVITIGFIVTHKERRNKVMSYLKNPIFVVHFLVITVFSIMTLSLDANNNEIKRRQESVKHALAALIIAIMAALDMKLGPFWLVFIISYYLHLN